jgi:hypothetical protein
LKDACAAFAPLVESAQSCNDSLHTATIWRVPLGGGEESQVLDGLSYSKNFVVGERGIYFVAVGDTRSTTSIDFFEFSTGRRTTLARIGKPWWFGITLSPDQRWLFFPTIDRDGRDLMVVEDVR